MAAPVGRSNAYEPARPAAQAAMPAHHAIGSTTCSLPEKIEPITAGTISRLNTRSTPAVATELVTTTANDRKKTKSQPHTASPRPASGRRFARQRKQRSPHQPVQQADRGIQGDELRDVGGIDGQNAADQDFLDVLRSLRRAIDDQYRRRGRDDIDDADKSLLADEAGETAGQRQQRGADRGEQQRVAESRRARRRIAVRERDGGAQRRQLRQREVGKNDPSAQHVHAEIGMHQDEHDRRRERKSEQRERIAHGAAAHPALWRASRRCSRTSAR